MSLAGCEQYCSSVKPSKRPAMVRAACWRAPQGLPADGPCLAMQPPSLIYSCPRNDGLPLTASEMVRWSSCLHSRIKTAASTEQACDFQFLRFQVVLWSHEERRSSSRSTDQATKITDTGILADSVLVHFSLTRGCPCPLDFLAPLLSCRSISFARPLEKS